MKKLSLFTLIILMTFMTTGCSTMGKWLIGTSATIDPDYAAYTQTIQAQLAANQKPLVDIKVDDSGKIAAITMYQPPKFIPVEQRRPHPVWNALETGLRVAAPIGYIWAVGDGIKNIVEASTGDTSYSYTNSLNDNSENSGNISATQTTTNTDSYNTTKTTTTITDMSE